MTDDKVYIVAPVGEGATRWEVRLENGHAIETFDRKRKAEDRAGQLMARNNRPGYITLDSSGRYLGFRAYEDYWKKKV